MSGQTTRSAVEEQDQGETFVKGIAHVGCRLLSLYWFFKGSATLATAIGMAIPALWYRSSYPFPDARAIVYIYVFPIAMYFAAAIILWTQAARLSRVLVPADSTLIDATALDVHGIQTLVFSGIGLYLILFTAPELVSNIYAHSALIEQTKIPIGFTVDQKVAIVELSLKLLLGAGMLLGARALSRILLWLRYAGLGNSD